MGMPLADLVETFLAWVSRARAPRTLQSYRTYLSRFLLHVGNMDSAALKAHHLLTFADDWHSIQAIQRCFSWAAEEAELIERNPFRKVKRPPVGQRNRILSAKERARLMRGARHDFRAFLLFLRETIARPQEVREFSWEHLRGPEGRENLLEDLQAGKAAFYLTEFKGRKRRKDTSARRIVPVSARLGRYLVRAARRAGQRPGEPFKLTWLILTNEDGRAWTPNALRLRMGRLRRRAGIGPDETGERVVCYTFRHTGATEACSLGIRDRVLAEMMGHANTRTTARYQHLQAEHLLQARKDLDQKRRDQRRAS